MYFGINTSYGHVFCFENITICFSIKTRVFNFFIGQIFVGIIQLDVKIEITKWEMRIVEYGFVFYNIRYDKYKDCIPHPFSKIKGPI